MTATPAFTINGTNYRAKAMDARRQLHVAMKLAGAFASFTDVDNPIAGLAGALSGMKPDDTDFVINACLILVEREIEGGAAWAPILTPEGVFSYEPLRTDLAAIMQMVIPILEANVRGFLSALPSDLTAKLMARLPKGSISPA